MSIFINFREQKITNIQDRPSGISWKKIGKLCGTYSTKNCTALRGTMS